MLVSQKKVNANLILVQVKVPKVCDDYVSGIDTCPSLKTDYDTLKRCFYP